VTAARVVAWLAAVMGLVAVSCLLAGVLLLPAADHSSSDSSPTSVAVILLVTVACLAALLCLALFLGLAVSKGVSRLRRRAAGTSGGADPSAAASLSGPGRPGSPEGVDGPGPR
jgi:hypothetical protein